MPISDAEAVAWAEEREGADENEPASKAREDQGGGAGLVEDRVADLATAADQGGTTTTPAGAPDDRDTAPPGRRDLTVVLTLLAGVGRDTTLRACYSVGAAGAPYPIISTLMAADAAWAAAQIPAKIAEAEARWLAQPSLPRATPGVTVARPAPEGTTSKATGAGKGKSKGKETPASGDAARLAAALREDTATGLRVAATAPDGPASESVLAGVSPAPEPPAPLPLAAAKPPAPATRGDQLSLFG